ncbi:MULTISPECIES: MFS transporter [Kitasatospora]|uniref:Putative major facilitator superfamily transporter n=1 Tax=Kitasatospora setae (strain ATCC 33774 / DSM 43861 / JCM 3304 / KCC A-0304 / NBRC 14216 / KM-6054) TaxID=452652 RepID=E4MZ84_KITSK|nr:MULTISPECIES: MFS transporter [Kitasatospora]BAJ29658.1 putative major facilitator superfamily transporter [Kitasatospora setae KM-6054]
MSVDPARTVPSLSASLPRPRADAPARGVPVFHPPGGRAAWLAWSVGVSVYVLAVVHRTSLGVAGLDAAARFGIGASALSTFSILQVLVYAGMQVPVGLLVDRIGPRRVLLLGVALMSAGQLAFAFSTAFAPALASRAVLGCGDAMTFISVLRVAARWFPAARNPFVAQLTGLVGTGGNLFTTVVLAQALHSAGWSATFGAIALTGAVVFAAVLGLLKEAPPGAPAPFAPGSARLPVGQQIRAAWSEPGTRLGMWVHFTTAFPASAFGLLWGMPYLVEGQGMSHAGAGGLLSLLVLSGMAFGLLFGRLVSRTAASRLPIAFTVLGATALCWTAALAWPHGHPPLWLLVVLMLVMGSNGPASLIGLDYARAHNPAERMGTATGIANMGGFIGSMVTLLGVGVLLDALADPGGDTHGAHAYQVAFCFQLLPLLLGTAMILRLRRRLDRPAG